MSAPRQSLDVQTIKVSCELCSLAELCLPRGLSEAEVHELDGIVKRGRPINRGKHLYRMNDQDHSLYLVRTGSFKSYLSTDDGDEQVVGFHLPGELVGLDAFETGRHTCSTMAMETSTVCELPGEKLNHVCQSVPGLHSQLQSLIGKEISADHSMLLLLGKKSAEEKLASFLVSLSRRFHERGFSPVEFNLCMSRQDIGNYLGLAVETISRLFAKFQEENLLAVDRRLIKIKDLQSLKSLVSTPVQKD